MSNNRRPNGFPVMKSAKVDGEWITTIDGIQVKDAKKSLRVDLVGIACRAPKRGHPRYCFAAKKLKNALHAEDVIVSRRNTYILSKGIYWRYMTTQALRTQEIAFDQTGDFFDAEYTIRAPSGAEKLGAQKKRGKRPPPSGKSTGKEIKPTKLSPHVRPRI